MSYHFSHGPIYPGSLYSIFVIAFLPELTARGEGSGDARYAYTSRAKLFAVISLDEEKETAFTLILPPL